MNKQLEDSSSEDDFNTRRLKDLESDLELIDIDAEATKHKIEVLQAYLLRLNYHKIRLTNDLLLLQSTKSNQ